MPDIKVNWDDARIEANIAKRPSGYRNGAIGGASPSR